MRYTILVVVGLLSVVYGACTYTETTTVQKVFLMVAAPAVAIAAGISGLVRGKC